MTLGQLRRSNLLAFINQRHAGNKAAFAEFIGVKRPQVYRYFPKKGKGQEPGEDFALRVERAYELPRGYFDRESQDAVISLTDQIEALVKADPGFRLLVQLVLDDPEVPIPAGIRETFKTMLDALKKGLVDAAGSGPPKAAAVSAGPQGLAAPR